MTNIVEILVAFGELAHWTKYSSGPDEVGGSGSYPPIIVWQYKKPSTEAEDFFRTAIGTFPGTIAWAFVVTDQTWFIMPSRIKEYSKAHDNLGELAVARQLMAADPEFGKRANTELGCLMEHIKRLMRGGCVTSRPGDATATAREENGAATH